MKRVCIVGVGAIGGLIGARLAASGQARVSALARGATLDALREYGWRLQTGSVLAQSPAIASDKAETLGRQDLVIIAVKAPALGAVAAQIAPLLEPDTVVLPAMNGVPWWFSSGIPALEGASLESVDPDGRIAKAIPQHHIVGAVVHASASTLGPGLVHQD